MNPDTKNGPSVAAMVIAKNLTERTERLEATIKGWSKPASSRHRQRALEAAAARAVDSLRQLGEMLAGLPHDYPRGAIDPSLLVAGACVRLNDNVQEQYSPLLAKAEREGEFVVLEVEPHRLHARSFIGTRVTIARSHIVFQGVAQ